MTRAIGAPFTQADTAAFLAAARERVRDAVRFRHQGRGERGVDCAGLTVVCMTQLGRETIDIPAYSREALGDKLKQQMILNFGEPVERASMQVGDIVLMKFKGEPSHIAVLADYLYGGLSVIHAYAASRKVIEHRLDEVWRSYISEVFRP